MGGHLEVNEWHRIYKISCGIDESVPGDGTGFLHIAADQVSQNVPTLTASPAMYLKPP